MSAFFLSGPAVFPNEIDVVIRSFFHPDQLVPGLRAEMRYIDDCGRIVGKDPEKGARRHGLEPFAGFQDGQGAQQAQCIQCFGFLCHGSQIFAWRTAVQPATTRM